MPSGTGFSPASIRRGPQSAARSSRRVRYESRPGAGGGVQWQEGSKRMSAVPVGRRAAYEAVVDAVQVELRRRLGTSFTVAELARESLTPICGFSLLPSKSRRESQVRMTAPSRWTRDSPGSCVVQWMRACGERAHRSDPRALSCLPPRQWADDSRAINPNARSPPTSVRRQPQHGVSVPNRPTPDRDVPRPVAVVLSPHGP